MAKMKWLETGKHFYETGVKQGALYPQAEGGTYDSGVPWDGLVSVTESPSGAEPNPLWADDTKYVTLTSAEEFAGTIEAYQSPKEFDACDGTVEIAPGVTISQQDRKPFGMAYKTTLGNDIKFNDYGYKLHLVYGALAAPSEKAYSSINDSPEAVTLSWEFSTTPVAVEGHKPTALLTIDSTTVDADKLKALEDILYGTENQEPRLPLPDEIKSLISGTTSDPEGAEG